MNTDTAIILLAAASPALPAAVDEEVARLRSRLPSVRSISVAEGVGDGPTFGSPWSMVIEAHGAVGAIGSALKGLGNRLHGVADAANSAIAIGVEHPVFERQSQGGSDVVRLYYAMFLGPLQQQEFVAYWRDTFAPYWLDLESKVDYHLRYRQFHADPAATALASQNAGFGIDDIAGIAVEDFASPAALASARVDPIFVEEAQKNLEYSDGRRNTGVLTRMRPMD